MKCIIAISLSLVPCVAFGQAAPHPSLDETLRLAKGRAYYASSVDWPAVSAEAYRRASSPGSGENEAIGYVVRALRDRHSFYAPSPTQSRPTHSAGKISLPRKPIAVFEGVEGSVPVLSINAWSGSGAAMSDAAAIVRSTLIQAAKRTDCGVILDFSANSGGNMWPMSAGLAPLFTEGVLGYFRDREGKDVQIERSGDSLLLAGKPTIRLTTELPGPVPNIRNVAILIGPKSMSSGEIVPIMFMSQKNVRVFGSKTGGVNSANSTFILPNRGMLALTTSITLDRNGSPVTGPIEPDVETDNPRKAAADWIASQCR